MAPQDSTFMKKIAVLLAIKLVALAALWWSVVREQRVMVDSNAAAAQMLGKQPTNLQE